VLKKSVWPYARFTRFITRFIPLLRACNIFTTVKDSEFLSFEKEQKTLAASLRHFTQFIARFIPFLRSYTVLRWCVDCKQSAAQERKKREKPILFGFMPFYIP
jgi:hypothetical protein